MPGSRHAENNEKVDTYAQNFEDAPRASITTRGQQREGLHLRPEFRGCSTRQRHHTRKTTRRSPLTPGISRTLHAPASRTTRGGPTDRPSDRLTDRLTDRPSDLPTDRPSPSTQKETRARLTRASQPRRKITWKTMISHGR